jgi:hypothetical protein
MLFDASRCIGQSLQTSGATVLGSLKPVCLCAARTYDPPFPATLPATDPIRTAAARTRRFRSYACRGRRQLPSSC